MSEEKDHDRGICLRPSHTLTLLLGGVLVLLTLQTVILGVLLLRDRPSTSPASAAGAKSGEATRNVAGNPEVVTGPWGTIEISEIVVSPPRNVFMYDYGDEQARWVFPDCSYDKIDGYLSNLGIPAELISKLKRFAAPYDGGKGTVVSPPSDQVWGLTPEIRESLYSRLAQFKENPIQREPFRFHGESFDAWFEGSGVSSSLVESVRKLCYRHNGYWLFSDLQLIWSLVDSPFAWTRFLQTLYQEQALSLKLRVPQDQDTAALAAYWGGAGELPQMDPVLNTARRQGQAVEIVYLLPPFARSRLNTYVNPSSMASGTVYNCHWAALNFFSQSPDNRFGKTEIAADYINANCSVVTGDPQYGDICAIVNKEGKLVHSCTYVAADIVFTKNGDAVFAPFVLDRLRNVRSLYRFYGGVKMVVVRPKRKRV